MKLTKLFSVQLIRHYAVWLIRLCMAFLFGFFIEPDFFGAFITASFLSTGLWTFTDLGFKQRALQLPHAIDLSSQKSIHFLLGVFISLILLGFSLEFTFNSNHTNRWILEFALITPLIAASIPSYVKLYWNKDIRFLAITDTITHSILQPLALLLLWIEELHWALTVSFVLPHIVHALIVLYRAQIEFNWDSTFLHKHTKSALKLGSADFLVQFRTKGDTLLLAYLSSPISVGLYNRGYALPHHVTNFIQAVLQPLLIPYLAKNKEHRKILSDSIHLKGVLIIAVLFFLFSIALHLLIQQFWLDSWSALLPYLPYFIIWGWGAFLSGLHESILKGDQKNSWVLFRQLLLTSYSLLFILFFHSHFELMIACISLGKLLFVLLESYWVYSFSIKKMSAQLIGSQIVGLAFFVF